MTNRIRRSFKIRSFDSDYYSDLDETPTEGQRFQLNPLACLNLESREPPVREQEQEQGATRILNPLTWRNRELYETQLLVCGRAITLKQLVDATRNFSHKMKLRRGLLGDVYKAKLPNRIVEVEKICLKSEDIDEITREVDARKSLEHENIVKLLDGYSSESLHLLIYEYMKNGSLEKAFTKRSSTVVLNWKTRFNICVEVARGLRYLHDASSLFKVSHGSIIKPSNIMLDAELTAKLSDFGFERFLGGAVDDLPSTRNMDTSMAPDFGMTPKTDVYDYGIVLYGIVTGRWDRAQDFANPEPFILVGEMDMLLHYEMVSESVDRRFGSSYNKKQASLIFNLAMICTDISPLRRPTMSEVVKILEGDLTIEELDSNAVST